MVSSDSSTEDDASCTEHFENLNGEGYVFTSEMIVWTEGLILNELKWDMNVVTPSSYINAMMYKLCQKNKKEDNKFFLPNIEYVQFVLEAARKGRPVPISSKEVHFTSWRSRVDFIT